MSGTKIKNYVVIGFWTETKSRFTQDIACDSPEDAIHAVRERLGDLESKSTSVVSVLEIDSDNADSVTKDVTPSSTVIVGPVGESAEICNIRRELPSDGDEAANAVIRAALHLIDETSDLGGDHRDRILIRFIEMSRRPSA